jgi:hypothetical protein
LIAEALKSNTSLTYLDLSKNEISDAGATSIAEALKSNTSLTNLDLSGNQISDAGAIPIAEALKSNTSLTNLDLNDNQISDEMERILMDPNDEMAVRHFFEEILQGNLGADCIAASVFVDDFVGFTLERVSNDHPLLQLFLPILENHVGIRRRFLNAVQSEYISHRLRFTQKGRERTILEAELQPEERQARSTLRLQQSIANIELIAELFRVQILSERIIRECIQNLLSDWNLQNPAPDEIETIVAFLKRVGRSIDHPSQRVYMDSYCVRIGQLAGHPALSPHSRSLLEDLQVLRQVAWDEEAQRIAIEVYTILPFPIAKEIVDFL